MNNKQKIQHSSSEEDRILHAAHRHFRHFGYGKTSMHDIAAACRMSAANLYRYYPGKLAIASAVVSAAQRALLGECDAAIAAANPATADRLTALFHAVIDGHRRQLKQAPLLFDLGIKVAREEPAMRRHFLDEIESRILRVLIGGRDCLPSFFNRLRTDAQLILVGCAPFVLPWMMSNEPFGDPRPRVEPLLSALVAGLDLEPHGKVAESRFG
ncbi:MAG TPA: TetR/AcrR family transcriptional regulator [Candidatus Didemnitutus sp.]